MSRDLESRESPEESIPLVVIKQSKLSDDVYDDDDDEGDDDDRGRSYEMAATFSGMEIEEDHKQKPKSIALESARACADDGLNMKYRIDFYEDECEGIFNFMKMKAKVDMEQVAKDAAKFLENLGTKFNAFEAIICIDDEDSISESGAELLSRLMQETNGSILLLANGLPEKVVVENRIDKIALVMCTTDVTGEAVSKSDNDKKYRGKLDRNYRRESGVENHIYDVIECVLLLDEASTYDVLHYKLAILKEMHERCFHCVKLILNGSKEMLLAMANGVYFKDNTGILISKNTGCLSTKVYSYLEACNNESRLPYLAQIDLVSAVKKHISDSDSIDTDIIFQNMKESFIKFHMFNDLEDTMDDALGNAIAKGLDQRINFLMDTSEAVLDRLSDKYYFNNVLTTLVFKRCGGFPDLLANYLQKCVYKKEYSEQKEHFVKILEMCDDESFIVNVNRNISKLRVYDDDDPDPETKNLVSIVRNSLGRWPSNDHLLQMGGTLQFKEFTLIEMMAALRYNRPDVFKSWLHMQVEIDTYIVCNLRFHWCDLDNRGERKVAERFMLSGRGRRDLQRRLQLGKHVNSAVGKLSNGVIADCFEEDGSPNVGIISPVQALIINRVFCMQFDFVKVLWMFDKQNILVNTVMIWILVNGILKQRIFSRDGGTTELIEAKDYFKKAIQRSLDQLLVMFPDKHFSILKCRVALFRGKSLYQLAGDGEFFRFLCHTVTKRCILAEWNSADNNEVKLKYLEELGNQGAGRTKHIILLRKPRIKLYSHMIVHVISYLMLAYYTLQPNHVASAALKWTLFAVITSLFVDEIRQALGEKQYPIRNSLKRWWSDSWNKLDLLSMAIYYTSFSLECGGATKTSRLFLSTFTVIWCLKFYQFLRAFESLGTYIILVQRMLRHLRNFVIVAAIAVISYGVFMTSLLFPGVKFDSWTLFIMVLLRPYLLFFAETGIEEYDISAKNTIYLTPKVDKASEVLTIIGMCVFLMFGGVLLLNLLIAIFSGIYEEVKAKSEKLWALNDLQLLQEFKCKPTVPAPLSLPINIFLIFKRLFTKAEVFFISDNNNSLALKIYQQDIAEQQCEKHNEPRVDSVIRQVDLQMSGYLELIKTMNEELKSSVINGHEKLTEEMQNGLVGTLRDVNETTCKMAKDVEAKLQAFQGNIEKKMAESISKSNEETNQRIKNVEIQCQEIATLLKQAIKTTKET